MKPPTGILRRFVARGMAAVYRALRRAEHEVAHHGLRKAARIGADVSLAADLVVRHREGLTIGDGTVVSKGCFFDCKGGLRIGRGCHISRDCVVFTHDHDLTTALPFGKEIPKPVTIGDNVWVGASVTIVPGVTVGDGAVMGCGCTVTRDVPPLAIVANQPHRMIRMRDPETYRRLSGGARPAAG